MKKLSALALALLLALSLAACDGETGDSSGSKGTDAASNGGSSSTPSGGTTGAAGSDKATVEEQVLIDQSDIKLILKSLDDSLFGPVLKVYAENNSAQPVTIQVRDCSVNGFMLSSVVFSANIVAGKKSNDEITFMSSQLTESGITEIGVVELSFHVFNSDTWDTIFDTDTITIETSAADRVSQNAPEEKTVAYDKDGIKISFVDFNTEATLGLDIKFYIENNTDTAITVQARDTSINGFMLSGVMSCDVMPGKMANTTLSFFQTTLDENDIESIESVELKFHIFDKDSWDTIADTDVITLE